MGRTVQLFLALRASCDPLPRKGGSGVGKGGDACIAPVEAVIPCRVGAGEVRTGGGDACIAPVEAVMRIDQQ